MKIRDRLIVPIIISLSIVIPIAVAALIWLPEEYKVQIGVVDVGSLPFFHALLNGTTAVMLLTGLYMIKIKSVRWHRMAMGTAFGLSAVFLVSYVIAKMSTPSTHYPDEAPMRMLYYFILISHILLSVPVLPLAMFAIYRGVTGEIEKHKKIVKYTFPIWLYVAVTGVLVYVFMAPYYV